MLVEERDSADVLLLAANGEQENAHSCILWACGSEFFRVNLTIRPYYKKYLDNGQNSI